jgi:hypothetical protein
MSFAKLKTSMPLVLKRHLFELENHCFFELFWLRGSPLIDLIKSQVTKSINDHKREIAAECTYEVTAGESGTSSQKENKHPAEEFNAQNLNSITMSHEVRFG